MLQRWPCRDHPEAEGLRYLDNDICVLCQREKMRSNYNKRKGYKTEQYRREATMRIAERLHREARETAEREKVEFDVAFSELCEMVPEKCPVSGKRLWKPVLFRIDDRGPFTADNLMVVSSSSTRLLYPRLNDRMSRDKVIQIRRAFKEDAVADEERKA